MSYRIWKNHGKWEVLVSIGRMDMRTKAPKPCEITTGKGSTNHRERLRRYLG